MRRPSKAAAAALSALAALLAIGIYTVSAAQREPFEARTVMTVDGEPVTAQELQLQLAAFRGAVYNRFVQTYGAQDGASFWTDSFDGEVPIETLRELAKREAVRVKVEQIYAKRLGVIQDIRYSTFLEALNRENRRRADAVKRRAVIYGPMQYDEKTYFDYVRSQLTIQVKAYQKERDWKLSEEQLRARYETIKDKLFRKPDTIEADDLFIAKTDDDGTPLSPARLQEAKETLARLAERLNEGEDAAAALQSGTNPALVRVRLKAQRFDAGTLRTDAEQRPLLLEAASELEVGQTSEPIDENDALHLIRIASRQAAGYKPFEEVRDQVLSTYADEKYEERIDSMLKEVSVDVNEAVYRKLNVR